MSATMTETFRCEKCSNCREERRCMLAGLSAEDRARVLATPKRRTWKMASTLRAIAEAEAERNYQLSLPASEMWTWGPVVKRAEAKARVEMEYELLNMHD